MASAASVAPHLVLGQVSSKAGSLFLMRVSSYFFRLIVHKGRSPHHPFLDISDPIG